MQEIAKLDSKINEIQSLKEMQDANEKLFDLPL